MNLNTISLAFLVGMANKYMGEVFLIFCPFFPVQSLLEQVRVFLCSFAAGEQPLWSHKRKVLHGVSCMGKVPSVVVGEPTLGLSQETKYTRQQLSSMGKLSSGSLSFFLKLQCAPGREERSHVTSGFF